jgi:hypothetical protein
MANKTMYLAALATFQTPASVREIHEKAREMFGDEVRGESISARQSLGRYVLLGKVRKIGTKYLAVQEALDGDAKLRIRIRELEAETAKLRGRIADLERTNKLSKAFQQDA